MQEKLREIRDRADGGDHEALIALGNAYATGALGVEKSDLMAVECYDRAASLGAVLAGGRVHAAAANNNDNDNNSSTATMTMMATTAAAAASSCDVMRAVARAGVMRQRSVRVPAVKHIRSRRFKLQYVAALLRRRTLLDTLIAANGGVDPHPDGRKIYLNLGARSPTPGDLSNVLFERQVCKKGEKGGGGAVLLPVEQQQMMMNCEHHAFEADHTMHEFWRAAEEKDPRIKYHPVAVWNKNTTLIFGSRRSASHVLQEKPEEPKASGGSSGSSAKKKASGAWAALTGFAGIFGADKKVTAETSVAAIDFSSWVLSHVREQDFVVLKVDIEGAEFVVLPGLLETGAACLIDEIYLECHMRDTGEVAQLRSYGDCLALIRAFEGVGTPTYMWF